MTATLEDIKGWIEQGQQNGATHLIVACDTWDHDNYPVYVSPEQDASEILADTLKGEYVSVDEVYSYALPIEQQLAERRAWHIESASRTPERSPGIEV